jgi:hypothetical protein
VNLVKFKAKKKCGMRFAIMKNKVDEDGKERCVIVRAGEKTSRCSLSKVRADIKRA